MRFNKCDDSGIIQYEVICRRCDGSGDPCSVCNNKSVYNEEHCDCVWGVHQKLIDVDGYSEVDFGNDCRCCHYGTTLYNDTTKSSYGYICSECGHEWDSENGYDD